MKENSIYIVITGDLISSKKVDNKAVLQEKVQGAMSKVNEEFRPPTLLSLLTLLREMNFRGL